MKKKLVWILLCLSVQCFAVFEYDNAIYKAQQGDWSTARAALEQLVAETPQNPQLAYDAGVACYKTNDYQAAANFFDVATRLPNANPSLQEQAHFNAGNAHIQLKEWDKAIAHYESALSINNKNEKTKHNLAYAQQMKQKEQEQQQSDKDESKKDSQDKNNDDEKEDNQNDKQEEQKNKNKENKSEQDQKNNDQKKDEKSQSQNKDNSKSSQSKEQDQNNDSGGNQTPKDMNQKSQNQSGNNSSSSPGNKQQGEQQRPQHANNQETDKSEKADQKKSEIKKGSAQEQARQQKEATGVKKDSVQPGKQQHGVGQSEQDRREAWIAQLLQAQEKADQAMNKMLIKSAVDKQCGEQSHEENSW
ncbi:hypothetical protein Noda2021_08020 [Candidatus Dependentiae bacterium Noda2021]|nr:hypothetical protein Noda2021_08020 [Candidatus Dependentiae bacterium Noda2021]